MGTLLYTGRRPILSLSPSLSSDMTQLIMLYCSLVNGTIFLLSYDDEDETNPERVSLGPSFSYLYGLPSQAPDPENRGRKNQIMLEEDSLQRASPLLFSRSAFNSTLLNQQEPSIYHRKQRSAWRSSDNQMYLQFVRESFNSKLS